MKASVAPLSERQQRPSQNEEFPRFGKLPFDMPRLGSSLHQQWRGEANACGRRPTCSCFVQLFFVEGGLKSVEEGVWTRQSPSSELGSIYFGRPCRLCLSEGSPWKACETYFWTCLSMIDDVRKLISIHCLTLRWPEAKS